MGDVLPTAHTDPDLAAMVEDSPVGPTPRPRLIVAGPTESFRSLWQDLAEQLDVEFEEQRDPESAGGDILAFVLNVAGAESEAVDLLREVVASGFNAPIVVGSEPDHRLAVELMRRGCDSYYALPGDAARLEAELERRAAGRQASEARAALGDSERSKYEFGSILGEDETLKRALDLVARAIPAAGTTVLITGETGTGKELVAQAIHANGPRSDQPFVAVNCSAIPANLLESELFGHERGAFTDARAAKPGLFELADGGTLFLDELSLLPLELQGKLLRVLETREVRRLGGMTDKPIDVRVLAAANSDLAAMTRDGTLREDLYYRLAVLTVELPPLRDRGDDVLLLTRQFLVDIAGDFGIEVPELSSEAIQALRSHAWPGNVRELRNAVERALLLADEGPIFARHLALSPGTASVGAGGTGTRPSGSGQSPVQSPGLPFPATLPEIELAAARLALEVAEGNKSEAARLLGITRTRLYRLLKVT